MGFDLKDYFAIKIFTTILKDDDIDTESHIERRAIQAYEMAEVMLRSRNTKNKNKTDTDTCPF